MKIRDIERRDRMQRHGLEYYLNGKRRRCYFSTTIERDAERAKLLEESEGIGFRVPAEDMLLLERCRQIIGPDVPLVEVCHFYARHHRAITPQKIEFAKKMFAFRREQMGLSVGRIRSGDAVIEGLNGSFGGNVGDISESMLTEWLLGLTFAGETKRSYRNHLKSFFDFCAEQGWARQLDFGLVKYGKVIEKEAIIMPLADIRALMDYSWREHPVYCGYLALGFFGGLRTSAACRLEFGNIKFDERGILMPAADSKTQKRHYVDGFPDALWAWLEAVRGRVGRDAFSITPRNWNRWRAEIAAEAGVVIPRNGLRKSFTSYMVAATGSADKVATLLTHRNPARLYQTYKGNASRADGLAFLRIRPKKV